MHLAYRQIYLVSMWSSLEENIKDELLKRGNKEENGCVCEDQCNFCLCELSTVCPIPTKRQRVLGNMLIFKAGFVLA